MVQTNQETSGNYPSSKWCFCLMVWLKGYGTIVEVVNGADKSRNRVGTTLPPNGVFALCLEDKMTKDPWLFWKGGVEVEM